ncbi:helix-turn-helix transcriptional regulator, partial [Pseudomonas sp. PA-5-4H]|uniref:helix-turn-helix transcriptional regulator n=1 Tax=Pseudomonas sp. PA-5-4H TaxID=2665480 RepID=UPI001F403256
MSRTTRLLTLLQALRGKKRPVTAAVLAAQLEVSERTLYRDIAELTALGAPIFGEAGVGLFLIQISEPTRRSKQFRMASSCFKIKNKVLVPTQESVQKLHAAL